MTTAEPNPIFENLPFQSPEEWRDVIEKFTANGRTFRDFTELTPDSMEVIYMVAYNLYNSGKYADAEKVFRLLCMLNHFERKYWKGLGAAREAQQRYEQALEVYGYLGITDLYDPYPPFHAAKCFTAVGKAAEAESSLRAAVFNSKDKPEHAALHAKAQGLLELIEKAREQTSTAGSN